jgi:hypothetical protein
MLQVHERGLLPSLEGAGWIAFHIVAPYRRGWREQWGATTAEARRVFPCDELIPRPCWGSTRAIDIQAAPEAVWPWLLQMGDGRAGLYSYQTLENMVGCKMRNLTVIAPEYQNLKVGDGIKLHDKIPALPVIYLQSYEGLVVGGGPGGPGAPQGVGTTWGWFLEARGPHQTRLIERYRTVYPPTRAARLAYGKAIMEPITFVMARKMLLGIKARAESQPMASRTPQPA